MNTQRPLTFDFASNLASNLASNPASNLASNLTSSLTSSLPLASGTYGWSTWLLKGLKGTRNVQHTPMANATHKAQNVGFIGAPGGFEGLPTGTVDALGERELLMGAHTLVGFG